MPLGVVSPSSITVILTSSEISGLCTQGSAKHEHGTFFVNWSRVLGIMGTVSIVPYRTAMLTTRSPGYRRVVRLLLRPFVFRPLLLPRASGPHPLLYRIVFFPLNVKHWVLQCGF